LLILVVLVQPSKGGGFAIYGGGGDTLFSAGSGSSFMKNMTASCAVTFAVTSLLLTLLSSRSGMNSVTTHMQFPAPAASTAAAPSAPAAPAAPEKP
jgi:preprotein translocase subunit SecG